MSWPERFVYVCSATAGAVVNVLPLIHAGAARIARIEVLCGIGNPDRPTAGERAEAQRPAQRLDRLAAAWHVESRRTTADPDSVQAWRQELKQIAAGTDLPIVLNLSGGRKQMAFGALLGLIDARADRPDTYRLLMVSGRPLRPEFVDGPAAEVPPAAARLTMADQLASHGYRELDPAGRTRREARFLAHGGRIAAFADALLPRAASLIPVLIGATDPVLPNQGRNFERGHITAFGGKARGGADDWRRAAVADSLMLLAGCPGLEPATDPAGRPCLYAATKDGAMLARSDWLEALLYLRLRDAVCASPGITIAAGVHLRYAPDEAEDTRSELGEIDVAIMLREQLVVIEAKLHGFGNRSAADGGEKGITQLTNLKRSLVGPFGDMLLVAPRESERALAERPGAFLDRARAAGIIPCLGPGAVAQAVEHVRALVARR